MDAVRRVREIGRQAGGEDPITRPATYLDHFPLHHLPEPELPL